MSATQSGSASGPYMSHLKLAVALRSMCVSKKLASMRQG